MMHVSRAAWGLFTLSLLQAFRSGMGIEPCPSTGQLLSVTNTEQATDLTRALNCSGGGVFDVLWEGTVFVNETIALTDGSIVTIAGVGSDAIADGGGSTQLFTVKNATLYLADVRLENGNALGGDTGESFKNGGAVWVGGIASVLSWSGTTAFNRNFAHFGGAVSIVDGAVASGTGRTKFTQNSVSLQGGALHLSEGAVTLTGETTFSNNSAVTGGGAIIAGLSQVSWSGVTLFENSTLSSGFQSAGTIASHSSELSWEGETSFIGGRGGNGGALQAFESNISWGGTNVFCDNVADLHGGALCIERSSNVSWTGVTLLCNNRADGPHDSGFGGAIHVADSTVSWNGATNFTNNSAGTGGALYGNGVASMVWDGTTTLTNNSAVSGGALYGAGGISMGWGGTITFRENTASTNGGAVALGAEVSLELRTVGTTFTGNVANMAGGALHQSGTSYGLTWTGVSFMSNSALNGGAVYSISSGAATEPNKEFPSKYIDCIFRNNTAVASGGAMESSAGKDDFLNTTFEGNSAGALGGALRLAGTTNLAHCDFESNGANEAGPAVASAGAIVLANISFTNNSLLCAPGTFLNYTVEGTGTAQELAKDYYNSVCDGCEVCSGDCPIDGNGTQQCIPALENTESAGVDASGWPITLETLEIDPGYWRSVSSSTTILPCWNGDACSGGITANANYCAVGYRGPYCAICEDDYASTLSYTCRKCASGEGVAFAVVALLVALVAVVAVFCRLMSNNQDQTDTGLKRLTQALPMQGLKIVVVAWQILTQFDAVANVTYAGVYGQFLDGIASLISLDLGLVLSAGCMVTTDFHDRLIISTLGPLVALGALGLSFQVATRKNHGSQEALQTVRRKHFSMALLVTFLIYSSVSSTVFRMFACETLDGGKEYLRADYTILCTGAKHKALQVYAGFMIVLYPIGIPVIYAIILYKHREVLKDGMQHHRSVQQSADLEVATGLWKPYTPERYYYEVVECARRVTLTGIVVFIYPNTAAQVAVTLVLVFVFVMVSESLAPYSSRQDSWLSRVAHIVVFLSMYQALVVKVDVSDESSESQEVFGGVLLAANICMVAAVIAEAVMVVYAVCGRGDADLEESVAPGMRRTTRTRSVVDRWDMLEGDATPTFIGTTS